MTRCEIAALGINSERRESLRWAEFDFDLAPLAIMCAVARLISDNILVAYLHTYFCRDIREFIQVLNREYPAAGHVRQGVQQCRPLSSSGVDIPLGSNRPIA